MIETLRSEQSGHHIADNIFKCIFLFENGHAWLISANAVAFGITMRNNLLWGMDYVTILTFNIIDIYQKFSGML